MKECPELNKSIGLKISKLRAKKKLTTIKLAEKVGVSQAQISRLENGKQGFRVSTLNSIAEALDTSIGEFFVDEVSPTVEVTVSEGGTNFVPPAAPEEPFTPAVPGEPQVIPSTFPAAEPEAS